MMGIITRPDMYKKVERMLRAGGSVYTFDDLLQFIHEGKMQSFLFGDTWVITQVHEYPRRKVVNIEFVVGFINEAIKALPQVYEFAHKIGATRVTALGRDGWWEFAQPGWFRVGSLYAKDLTNE